MGNGMRDGRGLPPGNFPFTGSVSGRRKIPLLRVLCAHCVRHKTFPPASFRIGSEGHTQRRLHLQVVVLHAGGGLGQVLIRQIEVQGHRLE